MRVGGVQAWAQSKKSASPRCSPGLVRTNQPEATAQPEATSFSVIGGSAGQADTARPGPERSDGSLSARFSAGFISSFFSFSAACFSQVGVEKNDIFHTF